MALSGENDCNITVVGHTDGSSGCLVAFPEAGVGCVDAGTGGESPIPMGWSRSWGMVIPLPGCADVQQHCHLLLLLSLMLCNWCSAVWVTPALIQG